MRLNQPQHLTSLREVDANLPACHIKLVLPSPLCCTYPPPLLYHFPASSWQVISCCRGNITGSPAGFTLRSGILPQAVESINTQRSLAGFGSQKSLDCFVFLTSHPPLSTHTVINLSYKSRNSDKVIRLHI